MVCFLPSDPSSPRTYTNFLPGGDPLTGFPQTAVNVLLEAADLRDLNFSLGMFKNIAEGLKGLFRSHIEMRDRAKSASDAYVSLLKAKPEPRKNIKTKGRPGSKKAILNP